MTADDLKEMVIEKLTELGFVVDSSGNLVMPSSDKAGIRRLHQPATQLELSKSRDWLAKKIPEYRTWFADGSDIEVANIKPILVQVKDGWQNDLWRIARFSWSLPYSQGYGRRMRYLIIDAFNQKLIGVFALQSPPIEFPVRDRLFEYPPGEKTYYVNQTMDIHTLGAVMPYSRLLGGKLVALATACNEVRQDYREKYSGRQTIIEGRQIPAELVALTTTSAFGRSSIYNSLIYDSGAIAESIGYTDGYGTFHLMELYSDFKAFLEAEGVSTQGGYGKGPRRKWQLIRTALRRLGFSGDLLQNGVRREAYLFPLVDNLKTYIQGDCSSPSYRNLPFSDLAAFWRNRWLVPRAERVDSWHNWQRERLLGTLVGEQ